MPSVPLFGNVPYILLLAGMSLLRLVDIYIGICILVLLEFIVVATVVDVVKGLVED